MEIGRVAEHVAIPKRGAEWQPGAPSSSPDPSTTRAGFPWPWSRSSRSQCSAKPGITASNKSVFMEFSSAARKLYGVRSSQTLPIRGSTAAASRSQIPLTPRATARIEAGSTSSCGRPEDRFPAECRAPASPANCVRSGWPARWSTSSRRMAAHLLPEHREAPVRGPPALSWRSCPLARLWMESSSCSSYPPLAAPPGFAAGLTEAGSSVPPISTPGSLSNRTC